MKKTLVALAVVGFTVATANAAPTANSVYVGTKAGWATFHHGINQFNSKYAQDGRYDSNHTLYGINRNSVTYGVFAGYQVIDNLAVEVGYDYFGRVRGNDGERLAFKDTKHGTTLSLKGNYEVIRGLDTYGKVGMALVRSDYKDYYTDSTKDKSHNFKASLTLGAGIEYSITPSLGARIEYQWLSRAGNYAKAEAKANQPTNLRYSPDIHSVSAGLVFRFGQAAAPVAVSAPEMVTKRFTFNSEVLFDFGKANLKASAPAELDRVQNEIQALGLNNSNIQVNGYTDRIGKDAPNLALSQRRAESVANYMVSKGVNPANITAVGYGKANPATGNTCDAVKGRQALIACLAPDRRVEIEVQGSKQIVM